ncbi:Uncharacterised protein [Actinomyces bovis]|uniref:Holin n=1 Tax=Actinomyces bovis TaxID=1658 RepID=A0ABY1VNX4_9ACTO|nr:hypothetical protein [Actinomyces bovis]SPT53093.1 Uncharacterised protein [Actinomyces bovis]SPT53808.1 Uncharacterised protein [Actinomyces bovis]VEG53171.1 Uncharacterised protein [Actinomyces israelii]
MTGKHVALQGDRPGVVAWLTPQRRKAAYALAAAILAFGAAIGWLTQEQVTVWLRVLEQLAGIVALLVAVVHTGGVYEGPVAGALASEDTEA